MSNVWEEMDVCFAPERELAIGLIALSNDSTIEPDISKFLDGQKVRLHTNRIESAKYLDVASLKGMQEHIGVAASRLLPNNHLDVIAFGCTSAAMALGAPLIEREIQHHHPGVKVTNPVTAAIEALRYLECRRVSVLTPYIGEVNDLVAGFLSNADLHLVRTGYFPVRDNDQRSYISASAYEAAALDLMAAGEAEALFISCTALATANIVEKLEKKLKKPVVTSNQALAWHALRLGGQQAHGESRGALMRPHPATGIRA